MTLSDVLDGVIVSKLFQTVYGKMVTTHETEIGAIRTDSRTVGRGDMFVAVPGASVDGHTYVAEAVGKGARAVVVERDEAISDAQCMHSGVVKVVVPDVRKALALIAANFFGRPAASMKVIGVTGTNGKTTTTQLIGSILQAGGERVATIGTIGVRFGPAMEPSTHTTPDPVELQRLFSRMRDDKVSAVSMEVSSHALDQSRVSGVPFACGVFTNLSQDHLDYHGSMERYGDAKKLLFDGLSASSFAVMNADDPWTARLVKDTKAHVITFGVGQDAQVRLINASLRTDGSTLEIQHEGSTVSVTTPLLGRFNVSNVLAGFAAGLALGIRVPALELGIASLDNVKGRFERVPSRHGWTAIIDYAHTPDALEKCLQAVREMMAAAAPGRIITVFGAGGDRDKGKRPEMGRIAADLSDEVIITSDNPRSEDPERIIDDIALGIRRTDGVSREPDRRKAIALAVSMARKDDIILVAGKGHEEVQVIGTERLHFSDREVVEEHV